MRPRWGTYHYNDWYFLRGCGLDISFPPPNLLGPLESFEDKINNFKNAKIAVTKMEQG